jgi:hypothetical protein
MGVNYQTAASITPEVGTMIADPRLVDYIKTNQGIESNLIPIYNLDGDVVGYERMLDPAIVHKTMKADNTLLHISIGKKLGRITEENMARSFNKMAIQLLVKHWEEGRDAHREGEYEAVNSSTDKQVARAWEVVPADMKAMLEDAFDGQVMIRREMISNTLGYYQPGLLEVYTGDASIDPKTRKIIFGLAQTFMGPKSLQITLAAESAVKELVAGAKDTIIVRSLSVPWNNFQAGATLVVANGVPVTKMVKWYQQGMREIRAYTRLQREVIELTVKIAGTADSGEKDRLRTLQVGKLAQQKRLSIYPLIQAGDLSDLPEGLEENVSHSFFSDISGWVNNHVREKIHPKAPAIMANVLFMRDSELHDAMSKAIQAGDFLARYAIYMHMVESGASSEDARDTVRDELVSYQTNPGRLRAGLEAYGMIWWSQFTIRAQAVMLRRFRKNPFSFFVAQGLGGMVGMPGPLDMSLTERGWDTSVGPDNIISAPSAYIWAKVF